MALVGSVVVKTDGDYAHMFAITWFVIGLVIAAARYALHRFNRDMPR